MFQPHHQCKNTIKLRREIQRISGLATVPDPIMKLHNRYHYALIHKLKSSQRHLEDLERLLNDTPPQDTVATDTSSEFHFNANLIIDSFFYSTGSALDILASEVLSYYPFPRPSIIYFQTARRVIFNNRPGDPLLPLLDDPAWKEEFSNYRNALTHELLVVGHFSLDINMDGGVQKQKIILPLPDNPRDDVDLRTYRKNPNALNYCTNTLKRVLSLVNQIHGEIANRVSAQNSLPL